MHFSLFIVCFLSIYIFFSWLIRKWLGKEHLEVELLYNTLFYLLIIPEIFIEEASHKHILLQNELKFALLWLMLLILPSFGTPKTLMIARKFNINPKNLSLCFRGVYCTLGIITLYLYFPVFVSEYSWFYFWFLGMSILFQLREPYSNTLEKDIFNNTSKKMDNTNKKFK